MIKRYAFKLLITYYIMLPISKDSGIWKTYILKKYEGVKTPKPQKEENFKKKKKVDHDRSNRRTS